MKRNYCCLTNYCLFFVTYTCSFASVYYQSKCIITVRMGKKHKENGVLADTDSFNDHKHINKPSSLVIISYYYSFQIKLMKSFVGGF